MTILEPAPGRGRANVGLRSSVAACAIALCACVPAEAWPAAPAVQPVAAVPRAAINVQPVSAQSARITGVGPNPASLLDDQFAPIDLASAVRLAGLRNPDLFLARQRVVEAAALRQFAAAQLLPDLNGGSNFDSHSGPLQQTPGDILRVSRSSLYVGAGANAVGSGTVNIPGVVWNVNVSNTIYGMLVSRQVLRERQFANRQTNNDILGDVGVAYYELMRAEGLRAVFLRIRDETAQVAEVTAAFAKVGEGRPADAERAATELAQRQVDVVGAEGKILVASARLCQLLNLDPSQRLHVTDGWVVPTPIVPDPIPLSELVAMSMLRRPDLAERRAAIREAFLSLQGSRVLPFSPNTFVGFSAGTFGGGSNVASEATSAPRFGDFSGRNDFDVIVYWTLQNLGYGNKALIDAARARLGQSDYQLLIVLNRARAEVAEAYALSMARWAQIATNEQATRSGQAGFQEDLLRTRNREGLPIETLNNLKLYARARIDYLNSIVDFNESQLRLYVALGQPRADMLARPVPPDAVAPPGGEAVAPGNAEPHAPRSPSPQT